MPEAGAVTEGPPYRRLWTRLVRADEADAAEVSALPPQPGLLAGGGLRRG
jgi:hypothetical protein